MNTYLIPYVEEVPKCDILCIHANSVEECQDKIIEHYADRFDDDILAGYSDYEEFLSELDNVYHIYLGDIHELEEYES